MRFLITLLFLHGTIFGDSASPKDIDRKGLFVRLEVPWTTLMAGESIRFHYILENASDGPTPVAYPTAKGGILWPMGGQPYIEAIPLLDHNAELNFHKAPWPPPGEAGSGIESWGELAPGHRVMWNDHQLYLPHFGVYTTEYLKAIKAHWQVGPQRWVSSDPISLKVINIPSSKRTSVFAVRWRTSPLQQENDRHDSAFKVPIDGHLFLFVGDGVPTRIAEIAEADTFESKVDNTSTNLEITILSGARKRKVFFNLRSRLVRDAPWPSGLPIKGYCPPEPIPPEELKVLRAKAAEQAGTGQPATRSESKSEGSDKPQPESERRSR